jgi:tetratricopeptide (TPR) repeat protein
VLVKYPESAVARTGRGGLLLGAGRVEEAEQELLASLRLMPTSVTTRLLLGMTYAKQGDPDRAIAAYREILTWRPDYVEARIRLGLAYEDKGLADQALGEYERALVDDPSASPALMFSAAIMEARGRIEDAIGQLQRVAPDDPIYHDAQLAIGRLANRGGTSNPMSSPQ